MKFRGLKLVITGGAVKGAVAGLAAAAALGAAGIVIPEIVESPGAAFADEAPLLERPELGMQVPGSISSAGSDLKGIADRVTIAGIAGGTLVPTIATSTNNDATKGDSTNNTNNGDQGQGQDPQEPPPPPPPPDVVATAMQAAQDAQGAAGDAGNSLDEQTKATLEIIDGKSEEARQSAADAQDEANRRMDGADEEINGVLLTIAGIVQEIQYQVSQFAPALNGLVRDAQEGFASLIESLPVDTEQLQDDINDAIAMLTGNAGELQSEVEGGIEDLDPNQAIEDGQGYADGAKQDAEEIAGGAGESAPNEILVFAFSIDSADPDGVLVPAISGQSYRFVANGTYKFDPRPGYMADTECSIVPGDAWISSRYQHTTLGDLFDLTVNGESVDWGGCNADLTFDVPGPVGHEYSYSTTAAGDSFNFLVNLSHRADGYAQGSLAVRVYQVLPAVSSAESSSGSMPDGTPASGSSSSGTTSNSSSLTDSVPSLPASESVTSGVEDATQAPLPDITGDSVDVGDPSGVTAVIPLAGGALIPAGIRRRSKTRSKKS